MPQQLTSAVTLVFLAAASGQDLKSRAISLRLAGLWIAFGAVLTVRLIADGELNAFSAVLSVMPGLFLMGTALLSGGRVGIGDGLIFAALGLTVGARDAFFLLGLSSLGAAVFGIAGLALSRLKKGTKIPFLPFVLASFILVLLLPG